MLLCLVMVLSLAACGTKEAAPEAGAEAAAPAGEVIEIQFGFENSLKEPLGQGVEKWAELLEEVSGGTMKIVPYPDSQLGNKTDIIDSMLLGEPVFISRWSPKDEDIYNNTLILPYFCVFITQRYAINLIKTRAMCVFYT